MSTKRSHNITLYGSDNYFLCGECPHNNNVHVAMMMTRRGGGNTLHIVRIVGLTGLIVLCTFYPFLPGEYDPLATSLSAMAQTVALAGLLVLPVGIAWLIFELQRRARRKRNVGAKARGYYFALASVMTASFVAAVDRHA